MFSVPLFLKWVFKQCHWAQTSTPDSLALLEATNISSIILNSSTLLHLLPATISLSTVATAPLPNHPLVLLLSDICQPLHQHLSHLIDWCCLLELLTEEQPLDLTLEAVPDFLVGLLSAEHLLILVLSVLVLVVRLGEEVRVGLWVAAVWIWMLRLRHLER